MSIKITQVRNAESLRPDNLRMNVEINHPEFGWIPYTLDPHDTDMTVNNDELLALIGTDFAAYVPPTQAELDYELAMRVRDSRFNLLVEVDAVAGNILRWAGLTPEEKAEWATYRQALLDVPQQDGFPNTVVWPTKPS